eukprot:436259_1
MNYEKGDIVQYNKQPARILDTKEHGTRIQIKYPWGNLNDEFVKKVEWVSIHDIESPHNSKPKYRCNNLSSSDSDQSFKYNTNEQKTHSKHSSIELYTSKTTKQYSLSPVNKSYSKLNLFFQFAFSSQNETKTICARPTDTIYKLCSRIASSSPNLHLNANNLQIQHKGNMLNNLNSQLSHYGIQENDFIVVKRKAIEYKEQSVQLQYNHQTTSTETKDINNERRNHKLILLVYVSRIIPIGAAVCAVGYIIYLLTKRDNWSTDSNSLDAEILRREASRGLFVSVVIAILMNLIGAFMFYIKVRESLVVVNYGFILGPVIGFLLDQSIGTDAGFRDFMTAAGFSYTFASLIGGNFVRYIVTVFLDLFISNPLQDILKTQVAKIGVIKVLKDNKTMKGKQKKEIVRKYDLFVAMNYPSILQSIVAFVTFNAYTNQTRFAWAYPNIDLSRELRIPPGSIMLSTAISGVVYLCFYTIMDYISDRNYFDINTKLGYVLVILALLYGLNLTESIEAPVQDEIDKEYTKAIAGAKPLLGLLMFTCFVFYGFVYPIYTRLGCCGKCKPKEAIIDETDHLAESEEIYDISPVELDKIKEIVKEEIAKLKNKGELNGQLNIELKQIYVTNLTNDDNVELGNDKNTSIQSNNDVVENMDESVTDQGSILDIGDDEIDNLMSMLED